MEESVAYLLAVAQGEVASLSGRPRVDQVRPILEGLLQETGLAAGQVQEIQWHGGDDEYWLGGLGEAQGFAPDVARFHWPVTPLLAHAMLHSIARSIEAGQRDLVLLAQETGGQVSVLLLGSAAVGRGLSAAPRARIGLKLALSSTPDGLLQAAHAAWDNAGRAPEDVRWLVSARRGAHTGTPPFSSARWLDTAPGTPAGDLFVLAALAKHLAEEEAPAGLLFSEGPTKSGLVTFLEQA